MQDETELVDIGEVGTSLEEEPAKEEPIAPSTGRYQVATLRERFAAFAIDSAILFYLYFALGQIAYRALYGKWEGPIPCYGWQGALFHGIFLFIAFLYYLIFEGAFASSTGKFFCWLYVRKKNGRHITFAGAFLRNLIRLFDYAIPIIPIFCMELTRAHQRLGDIVGGTTVMKRRTTPKAPYNVNMSNIASASGRIASFVIDLLICGGMLIGYLLLLSPENPGFSKWLLLSSPLLPGIYFAVSEAVTGTTPGKWLFGYIITHEDGTSVSFASAVVRTGLRVFDITPFGLITLWLSHKHQRAGDLAADTVVSRQKRRYSGAIIFGVWLIIASSILWLGMQNRTSFLSAEFKVNFLPTLEIMGTFGEESAYKTLTITDIRFAVGSPDTVRTPPVFKAGEELFVIFDLHGFERQGRLAWIQQDLEVRYPDGSIGLHQEDVVDYHKVTSSSTIELSNNITLPPDSMPGVYIVTITVRDLFAHERISEKQTFEVRSVEPPLNHVEQPSPPEIRSIPAPNF